MCSYPRGLPPTGKYQGGRCDHRFNAVLRRVTTDLSESVYSIAETKIRESKIRYFFIQIFNNKRKKSVSIIHFYNKVNQSFKQYVYLMRKKSLHYHFYGLW